MVNLKKGKMTSMQFSDEVLMQDAGAEPKRQGRSELLKAAPGTYGKEGQHQHEEQHFKNVSGLSISQISKSGLSNGQQMNQGGPGTMPAGHPVAVTQPFTPLVAGQGEESSVVIVHTEPDTSNDIAALFKSNS